MTMQIGDYDMYYIILDLGSDVNILICQMWEIMGKTPLEWSPIQLRLANQAKVIPVGRMGQVQVDIEGLCTFADFEVIDIVDDTTPYPVLLGIDWEMENQTIVNFKRRIISFEDEEMRVVAPLDPLEGPRYLEPVFNEWHGDHLDTIYNITTLWEDYINPTVDSNLSWKCDSSCTSDSGEALENWQHRLYMNSLRENVSG